MVQKTARRFSRINAVLETLEKRVLLSGTYDVDGVQPAALDQPRVNVLFRRSPTGDPLTAVDPIFGDTSFDVQAFLDTGTSGILLSQETTSGLGINARTVNGVPINYFDVGVGGAEQYNVSENLYTGIAPFSPVIDGTDATTFTQTGGPFSAELNPVPVTDPDTEDPVDIVGMPVMQNKVMVMDPKPVDNLGLMNTYLYDPGTPFNAATADSDPGIPATSFHVKLNYVDFSRFTFTDPQDAAGPTLSDNPMIGPNPLSQIDPTVPAGDSPAISMAETIDGGSYNSRGTFLFDSGAAASFISQQIAGNLHVHYSTDPAHSYGTDDPQLVDDNGNLVANQFQIPLGGTGGTVTAAGFYMSSLMLPTTEGTPIRFLNAPVLVLDVGLQDSNTGQTITLDGDFGMNFMVASLNLDADGSRGTPWDWVTFDQPNGLLGFAPSTGTSSGAIGIADAHIFYNNSYFDNFTPGVSPADNQAIATDKSPLLPGATATFSNYTSYDKGINGIMVDVLNVPNQLTLGDFSFLVGNSSNPNTWTNAPEPTLTYLPGGGDNGTDRYELIWPDNSIKGEWLEVTLLPTANSTLPSTDSIYFGNAPGESGNDPTNAFVDGSDFAYARDNQKNFLNPASVTDRGDFNRDHFVDGSDLAIARDNNTNFLSALQLITVPDQTTGTASPATKLAGASRSSKTSILLTPFASLYGKGNAAPTGAAAAGGSGTAGAVTVPITTTPPVTTSTPPVSSSPPPPTPIGTSTSAPVLTPPQQGALSGALVGGSDIPPAPIAASASGTRSSKDSGGMVMGPIAPVVVIKNKAHAKKPRRHAAGHLARMHAHKFSRKPITGSNLLDE